MGVMLAEHVSLLHFLVSGSLRLHIMSIQAI